MTAQPMPVNAIALEHRVPVNARMLALTRIVLAFSTLLLVWTYPAWQTDSARILHTFIALYCAYTLLIGLIAARHDWPRPGRLLHWTDLCFYAGLLFMTGGTSSIFFTFLYFALITASFSFGFTEGLRVTAASLVSFFVIALASEFFGVEPDLYQTVMRMVYLLVLGYMISYWGGQHQLLKRRLELLNEIGNVCPHRTGGDYLIRSNLNRLLRFYGEQSGMLIVRRSDMPAVCLMYSVTSGKHENSSGPVGISDRVADILFSFPATISVNYRRPLLGWQRTSALDVAQSRYVGADMAQCEAVANLLETTGFITVPYVQRGIAAGRLFIDNRQRMASRADFHFLSHAAGAIATIVENVSMMEELISSAAEHERLKISHDLHDSTIQPYIALKLSLDALRREAGEDSAFSRHLGEIIEMADVTIKDLRCFAARIEKNAFMHADALAAGITGQAERFSRFYGIDVALQLDVSAEVSDRLASEAFQIVSEGLSNILRHTSAKSAFVHVRAKGGHLLLRIGNESLGDGTSSLFMPRSIQERARMLGGATRVKQVPDGYTTVSVRLPLLPTL